MRPLTKEERLLYRAATGREAPWSLVQRWPWWWRDFRGFALGRFVFVKDDSDRALVCHELAHVAQFCASPARFWLRYLSALVRTGYRANPFEREARAIERRAARLLRASARLP
jgi:hypothetical protein